MNFPRYWAKGSFTGTNSTGQKVTIEAYGWSSDSTQEARNVENKRAKRVFEKWVSSDKKHEYEYGNKPFREEVIDSIKVDSKERS